MRTPTLKGPQEIGRPGPRRRGRPYLGNHKVTLKLSPAMVAALAKAACQLGLNKSELTEKALRHYLGHTEQ